MGLRALVRVRFRFGATKEKRKEEKRRALARQDLSTYQCRVWGAQIGTLASELARARPLRNAGPRRSSSLGRAPHRAARAAQIACTRRGAAQRAACRQFRLSTLSRSLARSLVGALVPPPRRRASHSGAVCVCVCAVLCAYRNCKRKLGRAQSGARCLSADWQSVRRATDRLSICVCVCVRASVRDCATVCVRACVRMSARARRATPFFVVIDLISSKFSTRAIKFTAIIITSGVWLFIGLFLRCKPVLEPRVWCSVCASQTNGGRASERASAAQRRESICVCV